jgi:alpha-N-arabinofuranosidase
MAIDRTTGPSAALPLSLQVTVKSASAHDQAGISIWDTGAFRSGRKQLITVSFYAKASDASIGPVTVSLVEDETGEQLVPPCPLLLQNGSSTSSRFIPVPRPNLRRTT